MHNLFSTIKWLLIILVIAAWMVLCLVNLNITSSFILFPGYVEFHSVPMSVILIFPLVMAFVTFWIVGILDQVDHYLQAREFRKRIRELEEEVDQLRNLPIREGTISQKAVDEENIS